MTAIVTGASSGMGRAFVRQIDQSGQYEEIWVIARSENKLNELKSTCQTPVRVMATDLGKTENLEEYRALLQRENPKIGLLVNAAGFGKFGHTDVIGLTEATDMIELNCRALVYITQVSLPYMKKDGHIVEIGSLSSFQPVPYMNVYAASKAFVLSYARGLNAELKNRRIFVTAVCPGWVKTPFFERAETKDKDAVVYFNRFYTPEQVVKKALRDMKKKKDVSILGIPVNIQVFLVKLLPHKLIMKIWLKQQKH